MPKIYNSKYINKTTAREYNAFAEEYFCGTDITIEINGVKTDVAAIDYTLQEQLKPIYGYASRTFDDVAVGSRIVVGSLLLPVKDTSNHEVFKNVVSNDENVDGDIATVDSYDTVIEEIKRNILKTKSNNTNNKEIIINEIPKNTKLYLSPNILNHFNSTNKKYSCEVLKDLEKSMYVYIKDLDIYCYIKKES